MALCLVEGIDHPGALCDHSDQVGLEQGIRAGLSYRSLRSSDSEDLADHFHAGLACIGTDGRSLVIIRDDLCAVIIDEVVPAVLVVGSVERIAVNAVRRACFRDLGSCVVDVFPCPVVCGSLYAVLVEDRLVVQKGDRIVVLGKRILMAAGLIQIHDAFIIVVQVDRVVCRDVIVQIQEQIVLHIHLRRVGVHPEYVGHLSAGSACFEQCPVVVPVNDVDLDSDTGFCGPCIRDLLNAGQLVVVPDVDLERSAGCIGRAGVSRGCRAGAGARAGAAAARCQRQYHD